MSEVKTHKTTSVSKVSKVTVTFIVISVILSFALAFVLFSDFSTRKPGNINGDTIYLDSGKVYVYENLEEAFDRNIDSDSSKQLTNLLPELLSSSSLDYFDSETDVVGLRFTKEYKETKEDVAVYKVGNYYLVEVEAPPTK